MRYILPAIALALMISGFLVQKRNRSPLTGRPMEARSITNYRRGEVLFFLGALFFLVDLLFVRR